MFFFFQFTGFGTIDPGYLGNAGAGQYLRTESGLALFITNMINSLYLVAGIGFFIYLATGGLRYLTAGGDPKAVQEATKQITHAIIGLAIVVGSYGAASILGNVLGVNIFHPIFQGP